MGILVQMKLIKDIFVGWGNYLKDNIGILNPQVKIEGERRLSICRDCPNRTGESCGLCGCFLPAKVVSSSTCPINKWDVNNKIQL